jgi:hypothetical protein
MEEFTALAILACTFCAAEALGAEFTNKAAFCDALSDYTVIDFEGIASAGGQAGAVELNGDDFSGLTLTAGPGADGLFVGIPDASVRGTNSTKFFAHDFFPTSGVACLSPDLTGPPNGAVIVDFDTRVGGVGVFFLDVEFGGASIEVFDGPGGTGNSLGVLSLGYRGDNLRAFTGVVASGNDIRSAVLAMGPGGGGDGVSMDDLFFGTIGIEVEIDVKPGSYPNPINSGSNGLVPVAILSSPEFDARQVEPTTVVLAGATVGVRGKGKSMAHEEDVNGDGLIDLVVQVETQSFAGLGGREEHCH